MRIQVGDIYKIEGAGSQRWYFRILNFNEVKKQTAKNLISVSSREIETHLYNKRGYHANHYVYLKDIVLKKEIVQHFKSDRQLLSYLKLIDKPL